MYFLVYRREERRFEVACSVPRTRDGWTFDAPERLSQRHVHPGPKISRRLDLAGSRGRFETIGVRKGSDRKQTVTQMQQRHEISAHCAI
jgi:hypothetical protein